MQHVQDKFKLAKTEVIFFHLFIFVTTSSPEANIVHISCFIKIFSTKKKVIYWYQAFGLSITFFIFT